MRLGLAICVVALVSCTSCSRNEAHSLGEIVRAWTDLCVLNGPTAENAELLAKTFSLESFDVGDMSKWKTLDEKERRLIDSEPRAAPIVWYPQKTEGWWFDRSNDSSVLYEFALSTMHAPPTPAADTFCSAERTSGCLVSSTYRVGTGNASSCTISGNADKSDVVTSSIDYVEGLKLTNLHSIMATDLQGRRVGTQVMISGTKGDVAVQIVIRNLAFNEDQRAAILSSDVGWFKTHRTLFEGVRGPSSGVFGGPAGYFNGPVHVTFSASRSKNINTQICRLNLSTRSYECRSEQ